MTALLHCLVLIWLLATPARAEIVVAVPAPTTGARAAVGLAMHTAAGIIAAEINAAGGIDGVAVRLDLHDDPCGQASIPLARTIAASAATTVIGHPCPSARAVVAPVYRAAAKLFIGAGVAAVRGSAAGDLRIPAVAAQGEALGNYVVRLAAGRDVRAAIIRDRTQLNTALANGAEAALRAARIPVVTEVFKGGDKDFTTLAQRLAAAGTTHVALMAFTIEGALLTADLAAHIPGITIIGPDQLATADFGDLAGGTAAARVRILLPASAARYRARFASAETLAERMAAIGVPITREALEVAAALQAWAAAARSAGSLTTATLTAALAVPRATLLGPLAFDAKGDASLIYWIPHRWHASGFVPDAAAD